ncbi:phosphoglucosamine mutase [Pontivivens insulae]|uniref:Phosphoglucosamine mutase n=1 Tax=Pontivivens insulae TaxID=1639689 RepID=A0A2R8ACX7_9RHOB|nr:phosphoglucosamine mutase [Pontivivens insulae]RED13948.1 phosphoglucosamine mutase [Pontivivens insulae]SPF30022.1 Phosphoglucosamine mutase [Pontivivens insulae]
MSSSMFGTDGVRGRANSGNMTAETAMRLGMAAGTWFRTKEGARQVVIGKDTRRSGYMLETAMTAGFAAVGMSTLMLGPLPTPAVGMLTRSMRADLGVMISASHNPHHDNGIKFFGPDGFKLSDDAQAGIEDLIANPPELVDPEAIGRSRRVEDGIGRYAEFVKTTIPRRLRLKGLRVVLDCANGAAYKVAPQVLWELGADVIPIGVSPNGYNINKDCGSTSTDAAARAVVEYRADIGLTLDGDADRIIVLDETGRQADGDQIMALIAGRVLDKGDHMVATVMSNLGLERHLETRGIGLKRTKVGDRYVVEEMRRGGYRVGGEQSGHIVLTDFVTTGDGLIAGLQVLAALIESGKKASELLHVFEPVPQTLKNVRFKAGTAPLSAAKVKEAIADGEAAFADRGRLVIRASGTEPLIRVMGECEDKTLLHKVVDSIADEVARVT